MNPRSPFDDQTGADRVHLRLLATTDLHVHICPYDYYSDRPDRTVGLARTATLIGEHRRTAANTLLFDLGDGIQGNPMGDCVAEAPVNTVGTHPMVAALNTVGADAATIGNHDFNYGLEFLKAAMAKARYPVVLANVTTRSGPTPEDDKTLFPPFALLDRAVTDGAGRAHSIRIGVIGLTPPQILKWDWKHLQGRVAARDIVDTARARAPAMRAAGADLIVALAHTGIGSDAHRQGMENAAVPLAAVAGIDVVFAGHQHMVFPGPDFAATEAVDPAAGTLHGKPAVMAGFRGSHLGVVDLLVERSGEGWRVLASASAAQPIAGSPDAGLPESDPAVLASVRDAHEATLAYVRRPVGRTAKPLHSYFAQIVDDPSVQIVNRAQVWHAAEALQGTDLAGLPLLSAASPFKAGGRAGPAFYTDVPVGDLSMRHIADLYIYPNTFRVVRVRGAGVKDWLERSAALYCQIAPGAQDAPFLNQTSSSYDFDVIYGVSYRIDVSQPPKFDPSGGLLNPGAGRIADLCYRGRPVDPAQDYLVVTNNYRSGGGGSFPGASDGAVVFESQEQNRDVLLRYVAAEGTIRPAPEVNWRFVPMPGTSVVFDTGPGALAHPDRVHALGLEPVGRTEAGFVRMRLRL